VDEPAAGGDPTDIYLYNPHGDDLTINYVDTLSSIIKSRA